MRHVLLVLTQSMSPLNDIVSAAQHSLTETRVEVVDLTVETPDYGRLLESIFAADSVQVW